VRREISRFLAVGVASNLINFATYFILWNAGVSLITASIGGYTAGLYNSYYFGRRWVFEAQNTPHGLATLRFTIIYLIGGVGMAAIIKGLDHLFAWDYRVAWIAGAAFAFTNNFLGSKWLVFNRSKD